MKNANLLSFYYRVDWTKKDSDTKLVLIKKKGPVDKKKPSEYKESVNEKEHGFNTFVAISQSQSK